MSRVVELLCSRRVPHVAALALMSIGFAGCSADMSTRLSQNSFSNPFASQPEATGSVPTPAVERRELPQYSRPQSQYQSQALPPPIAAPQSYPAASSGVSGGGRGLASYAPPAHPIETTGTVAPRSVAATRGAGPGGTTIIVGTSDTLDLLARRYNVSPAAILQANGYKGPRTLSPGQQLIIPHQATAVARAPAPALAAPASKPVAAAERRHRSCRQSRRHAAQHRPSQSCVGRRTRQSQQPRSPGQAQARHQADRARREDRGRRAGGAAGGCRRRAACRGIGATRHQNGRGAAGPQQSARLAQATTKVEEPSAEAPVKAAEATGALPTFRWPVRGKVITSYGAKTNGKSNDGINLAVPEGTPVKAAEDGVVAYSGNELKGYGNLVLVRHSNGYVTAYAHASELLVKRGDTIKRGQIIAKSGQSGEVGSPQLHFEIRKGSSPVDPLQFLNGA